MAVNEKRRKQLREAAKRFRARHRERLRDYQRRYRQTERGRETEKRYRLQHKDRHRGTAKRYHKHHPEKRRSYHFRATYGISVDDYNRLLILQNNVCAICKQPETLIHPKSGRVRALSVDHNHRTRSVRGLLCHRCNMLVGIVENHSFALLKGIRDYLCI